MCKIAYISKTPLTPLMLNEEDEMRRSDASHRDMGKGGISIIQPVLSIVKHLSISCLVPLRQ